MNRHERRKAGRGQQNTSVACEIFVTPNLGESEVFLDVHRMRGWAEKNVVLQRIKIDAEHVQRLVEDGVVTEERILEYTVKNAPKPILLCEHPDGEGDEIVDGNHTYVASAIQWAEAFENGDMPETMTPFVLGYGLTPAQWQQFSVPKSQLRKRS